MKDVYFDVANKYDDGVQTSVAVNADDVAVEVHKSQWDSGLWYHLGRINGGYVDWGGSMEYDSGITPAVALNNQGTVVEVHQTQSPVSSSMYYHVGVVNGNSIDWGGSHEYDDGHNPSVAINDSGVVVEVHETSNIVSYSMYYHVGIVNRDKKTIDWGDSHDYDSGVSPHIAMNSSGLVVEVHKSQGYSKLYYHVGKVNTSKKTIDWGDSHEYQDGVAPSVALTDDGFVIEVHQSEGFNTIYRLVGQVDENAKTITWSGSRQCNTISTNNGSGSAPSVGTNGSLCVETYNSGSDLWYSGSLVLDRTSWMYTHRAVWGNKPLKQMSFPGSHDAGMDITQNCTLGGFSCNTQTQTDNFYDRLQAGARYYDVRPVWYKGAFATGHYGDTPIGIQGCNGESLANILNDVARYIQDGGHDVVILKFSHYYDKDADSWGFTDSQKTQLITTVKNALGTDLYLNTTGDRLADIPLNTLLGNGGTVLAVFDDMSSSLLQPGTYTYADYHPDSPSLNADLVVYDDYSKTNDLGTMTSGQLGKMEDTANHGGDLFLLSWTLTQSDTQASTCMTSLADSILDLAKEADGVLAQNITQVYQQQRITGKDIPNILYVDITSGFATDVSVWLNQRLSLGDTLYGNQNQYMIPGDNLYSADGNYRLMYQADGNLVIYNSSGGAVWATGTNGQPAWRCIMQADGNFVIYKAPYQAIWATGTNGHANSKVVMQNSGKLVLYDASNQILWQS